MLMLFLRCVGYILILLTSSAIGVNCYAQSSKILSLDAVLQEHYLNSIDAKIFKLQRNQDALEIENFKLSNLPSVSFNLSPISFSQSIISLQDPVSGNFYYTNSFTNNSGLGFSVSQPLNFTGGRLQLSSSLNMLNEFSLNRNTFSSTPLRISYSQPLVGGAKMYKFDKKITKLKEQNLPNDIKSKHYSVQQRCVELYMRVLICDLYLKNSEINMQISDTIHYISNVKQSLNDITEQDFLQAEMQYEQGKIDVINMQLQYDKALRELLTYLNLEHTDYEVVTPKYNLISHIDINSALLNAENNGAQFNKYQIQKTEAERELYSAKLQRSFNGDVNLSFGLNQYGDQFYKAYYKPSTQQSLMIGLRIPIFDWGVQSNKYEIAKSRYQTAMLNTENQENNTLESIRKAVEDYNYNVKVIDVMKRQAELALKQYRLTVKMFAGGNNTFFELATARNQSLDSERAYLEQLSRLWVNYYTIRTLTITEY